MEQIGKQKMAWQKDELAAMHHEVHVAAFVAKGRLHSPVKQKVLILLLVLFVALLSLPALFQAYKEFRDPEGVQSLHLIRDIFWTPNQHAKAVRTKLESIVFSLEKGNWTDSNSLAWEELSQGVVQSAQVFQIVNRHVGLDSLDPKFQPWRKIRALSLVTAENPQPDSIQKLKEGIRRLLQSHDLKAGLIPCLERIAESVVRYTLFSRSYLRAWEKEMEEVSSFAQFSRPWLQQGRFLLFRDYGNKAVEGEQGWVFYRPGIEYSLRPWVTDVRSRIVDPNDKSLTDDPVLAIVEFKNQLKEWGVDLLVVPVPNKETIYPDYLNSNLSISESGLVGHGMNILDSLRVHGVAVVDLYSAFAQERLKDQGMQDALYLRDDTHWQLRGLKLASKLVGKEIQKQSWFNTEPRSSKEYKSRQCNVARDGDILAMSKLPSRWFASESVPCSQIFSVERDSLGQIIDSSLYKVDFRKSRILILGDSFSRIFQTDAPTAGGWIAHLALELGEPVASLVSDGGASTLVREKLARKPGVLRGKKLVVWEFVERDYRFGDSGWKTVNLNPM